ncbi:MAG: hypothetical protein K0S25_119 [Bacillus sp. (in: firmicutes)]|jgi:DNA-binding protein YbaB|nr:hypothetical protein [Bacillus sp. (in: firmicutes)]
MNYTVLQFLPQLTNDDIRYICSVVPYQDTLAYFRKYPKQFTKIRPGFRVKAISKTEASKLLFNFKNRPFISNFIEKHISDWLAQIKTYCNKRTEDGDSKDIALLKTLPFCFFSDNVGLYFKLINEEHSEEYIALTNAALKSIKKASDKQDGLNEALRDKDLEIKKLNTKIHVERSELSKTKGELTNKLSQINDLNKQVSQLYKIQIASQKGEQKINSLKSKIQTYEEKIKNLKIELEEKIIDNTQLKEKVKAEFEKKQAVKTIEIPSATRTICPSDIEEFKDYLGYNLENIGLSSEEECYPILKVHLSKILFQGIPIIINRLTGINTMKCVANTLIGLPTIKTLAFSQDTSVEEVKHFLNTDDRIVCLDNFIGNFNETELLPLFESHREKIIFLTVVYDRILNYISDEFFRYCHYLNVNRIQALSINTILTEEPYTITEVDSEPHNIRTKNRYSTILRMVLRELYFQQSMIEQKCAQIFDEQDLCCLLAFDILPYFSDVLHKSPYNMSEHLIKYAGNSGRCSHKSLLMEWFAL